MIWLCVSLFTVGALIGYRVKKSKADFLHDEIHRLQMVLQHRNATIEKYKKILPDRERRQYDN